TGRLRSEFLAYDAGFRGGVSLALGDVDDDSGPDIVTGAGPGGGPHVKIFNGSAAVNGRAHPVLRNGFMAYDPAFRGGVNVAVGDTDTDQKQEIITGPGAGGGPVVRVFHLDPYGIGVRRLREFAAYDPAFRGGVTVAAANV